MKHLLLALVAFTSFSAFSAEYWQGFKAFCTDKQGKVIASVVNDKLFMKGGLNGLFPQENLVGKLASIRSGRMVEGWREERPVEVVASAIDKYGIPHELTVHFDRLNQMVDIYDQTYRAGGVVKVNLFRVVVKCAELKYVN